MLVRCRSLRAKEVAAARNRVLVGQFAVSRLILMGLCPKPRQRVGGAEPANFAPI